MEEGIRRSAPNQRRIRARDAKFIAREIAYAQSRNWRKIPCLWRLHMKEFELTLPSYKRCVKANSRHPWFYGTSELSLCKFMKERCRHILNLFGHKIC